MRDFAVGKLVLDLATTGRCAWFDVGAYDDIAVYAEFDGTLSTGVLEILYALDPSRGLTWTPTRQLTTANTYVYATQDGQPFRWIGANVKTASSGKYCTVHVHATATGGTGKVLDLDSRFGCPN